jgi:hypothetical protein
MNNASLEHISHIDEILDCIFMYLNTPILVHKISLVNKQWNRVAFLHIDYGRDVTCPAITLASVRGYSDMVNRLLQHPKVDPCIRDNEPIRGASSRGNLEVVKLLLQHPKVDPSAWDHSALQWACYYGH